MSTGTDGDLKTPPRLDEPMSCVHCGEPLSRYLADYQRFAHIRCLLTRVPGWAPPQGQPHYVW
jgi:hypothetical protein